MPFTMKLKRYAALAAITLSLTAQTRETYKARLSPVPADARTRADLTGSGSATAMLEVDRSSRSTDRSKD